MNNEEEHHKKEEPQSESPSTTSCDHCEEYLVGWKRALADYDNLKKELGRERDVIRQSAREEMAHRLFGILDNFDQALRFAPQDLSPELQTWVQGVLHVRSQLEEVMKSLGLQSFGAVGDVFDPHIHEASAERQESEKQPQEILEISQRGWRMGAKVIRPAKVVVNNL